MTTFSDVESEKRTEGCGVLVMVMVIRGVGNVLLLYQDALYAWIQFVRCHHAVTYYLCIFLWVDVTSNEKVFCFFSKGPRKLCPISSFLFKWKSSFCVTINKYILTKIGRKEITFSIFASDIIFYTGTKDSTENVLGF